MLIKLEICKMDDFQASGSLSEEVAHYFEMEGTEVCMKLHYFGFISVRLNGLPSLSCIMVLFFGEIY